MFSKSVPTSPFLSSENSISGHLLKSILPLYLLDLCFTTFSMTVTVLRLNLRSIYMVTRCMLPSIDTQIYIYRYMFTWVYLRLHAVNFTWVYLRLHPESFPWVYLSLHPMNFTWDCIHWTLLGTASNELYLGQHPVNFTWACPQWT